MAGIRAENGPFILPNDRNGKGFSSEIAIVAAIRARGQQNRPPLAVGKLNQIGVSGAVDGIIPAQVAMGEHGVTRINLVRSLNLAASENGDAVIVVGSALGNHQIVPATDFV